MENRWNVYVGLAATAIERNNDVDLEVYVPELLPFKTGLIKKDDQPVSKTVTLQTLQKSALTATVKLSNTIKCEYLGLSTNNDVPDIHVGEQVLVINFAGTEKYYWIALGRDDRFRRVEHYKIKIADIPITLKELNDDNTYFFEMDTRNGKRITLSTSMSDGELFRYKIEIDAKANTVTIQDNVGNYFQLKSPTNELIMKNMIGSFIQIIGPFINMFAIKDLNITAGENINIAAGKNMNVVATDKLTRTSKDLSEQHKTITTLAENMIETSKTRSINAKKGNVGHSFPFS